MRSAQAPLSHGGTTSWQAFLAFIHHPAASQLLKGYNLGSSDSEAKHSLLLDRERLALFVALVKEAEKFLSEQCPKEPPIHMTKEEWETFVNKVLAQQRDVSIDEIQQRIDQQYKLIEELQQWLDK
jgi:predicted DNA-binding protein (MmcQ/YjbR family)